MTQRVANNRAVSFFALKRRGRYSAFASLHHESRNLYYASGGYYVRGEGVETGYFVEGTPVSFANVSYLSANKLVGLTI